MQTKTTVRYHLKPVSMAIIIKTKKITSVDDDVQKRELLHTIAGSVQWCSCYGKTVWWFLKNLKTELPHDPGVPILGIKQAEW